MTYKTIGCALCAFMVMCTGFTGVSANADTPPIDIRLEKIDLSGTVTITGSIDEKTEGKNVTLAVYPEENSHDGLMNADNQIGYISAFSDTYTNAEGEFEFNFQINGEQRSGFYRARIGELSAEMPAEIVFLYSNIESRKSAIEVLNTKKTSEEVYNYVFGENGKWMDLGFYSEIQGSLDKHRLSDLIAERLCKSGGFDADKGNEVSAEYLYLEVIDALNEKKIDNISDYMERLRLSDSKITEWYEKKYITASVRKNITDRLSGKNIKTAEEFENSFVEAVVLETVEHNDGPGTVRDILREYADKIDADIASAKISDFKKLTGSYASYAELEDKLNEIMNGNGSGGGGSSSGGSGSGGGMSGVRNSVIEKTVEKTPEAMKVQNEKFTDLKDAEWAREAVTALADKGVVAGRSENVFAPNESITREEFVKILVAAFEIDLTKESAGFIDVKDGEWYEVYVNSAYKAGIIKGIGENRFGTGRKISRQDMAVMVHKAAKLCGIEFATASEMTEFSDADKIADYATEAVCAMHMAGVICGVGDNLFDPSGNATRAEAAKIVYELILLR